MVQLRNKSPRMVVVNLPHHEVCGDNDCCCEMVEHRSRVLDPQSGEYVVQLSDRKISGSVHLPPGETSEPLPEAAASCTDVLNAGREIEIVRAS